jgi:hypothetical protein
MGEPAPRIQEPTMANLLDHRVSIVLFSMDTHIVIHMDLFHASSALFNCQPKMFIIALS